MACELYDTTARPTVDGIGGYIELEHDICHSMQELHSKLLPLFSTDSFTSYVMCSRLPINVVCASAALWPVVIISYLGTSKLYDRESSNCAVGQILRNIKLCFAIPAICMREILLHGLTMSEQRQGIGILKLFDEMESVNGVPREPKHYGCMADLPGRAGLIKEVTEMIKDIPKGGDMSVWSGLLGGRRIHGDVEIAEKAAKHKLLLGYWKSMASRLRGTATYATSTPPKLKSYAETADQFGHQYHQESKHSKKVRGDFVPVYVAIGMITVSISLGLYTAKQQVLCAPNVRVRKKTRETVPEVVDPDKVVDEADKFIRKSFFRKVAHVQEFDHNGLQYLPDPSRKDVFAQKPRAETLKDVGIDPKSQL
ncbi:hypothetical protein D5086_027298 [Populus alba]|uniref:Uncharacterized protein n=1 Tax=Populus alba TaxID=43335 RepID=A0ACC4AVM1_POPAL